MQGPATGGEVWRRRRFCSERGEEACGLPARPRPAAAGSARGSVSVACRPRPARSHHSTVAATCREGGERAGPPIGRRQDPSQPPFPGETRQVTPCLGEPCSPLRVARNVRGGFSGALRPRAGVPPARGWGRAGQRTWTKALRTRFPARGSLWEKGRSVTSVLTSVFWRLSSPPQILGDCG